MQATSPAGAGTTAAGTATPGTAASDSGRFVYVVVGSGGFLGIGQQTVPVPWSAFTIDPQARTFTANFDEQTFKQAPTIDVNKLPQSSSTDWDGVIRAYWASRLGSSGGAAVPTTASPTSTAATGASPTGTAATQ
jgi:hypothetical protein